MNRRYEQLAHHDFVFSRDPKEEFNWIYNRGEPAPEPTCYLAATVVTDPSTAPPGGEALYVLVHTPYLRPHHNWKEMLPGWIAADALDQDRAGESVEPTCVQSRTPRSATAVGMP